MLQELRTCVYSSAHTFVCMVVHAVLYGVLSYRLTSHESILMS